MLFMIFQIVLIVSSVCTVLFFVISIIFYIKNQNKKATIANVVAALSCALFSIFTFLNTGIPEPNIYPLNSDSKTYSESIEITILTDESDIIDIYYSLDGSDPKNGRLYDSPIVISNSTTICARSKFWGRWSKIVKESYKVEPGSSSKQQTDNYSNQTENKKTSNIEEGLDISEGFALMTYINQYRTQSGTTRLEWDADLAHISQNIATKYAYEICPSVDLSYTIVDRQCNETKNAQKAVSDWITGNDYIPSEAESILNNNFTKMGGALYYLPNGNEYGYHYFWVVCFR